MKRSLEGEDRSPATSFAERLDDYYIAEDNPVSVTDYRSESTEFFPSSFLTRSASYPAAIGLTILTTLRIDVASLNTPA